MIVDPDLLGYFRREAATQPEPFTGERLTSAISGQVAIEHYHRYLLARSFCLGKDVLDVASGEGYGAAQLAQVARTVVGIEYATATVRSARANFPHRNLCFANADARSLPLADASVDIVVSFETIEHFNGQDTFVAEVRRVLRPDGCFIVSTPDRDNYAPTGAPTNTHHVRELSRREFDALLSRHFRHVHYLYQRPLIGSALLAETEVPDLPLVFERRGPDRFEASLGLPRPVYIVAIATSADPVLAPNSLYIERPDLDTDGQALARQAHRLAALAADAEAARAEAAALRRQMEAMALARDEDADRLRAAEAREAALREQLEEAERVAGSLRRFLRGYFQRLAGYVVGR